MLFSPKQFFRRIAFAAGEARRAYAVTGSGIEAYLRVRGGGGPYVSSETSTQVAAVFACVRVLSEAVAMLPLFILESHDSGSKRKKVLRDHPLFTLLHDAPNPEITSFQFRQYMMANLVLTGNAYAYTQRVAGQVVALWPIASWRVTPERNADGRMMYGVLKRNGQPEVYGRHEMFHLTGLSWDDDPLIGINPIEAQRKTIGLAMSAHEHGEAFFESGAIGKVAIQSPGVTPEEIQNIQQAWMQNHWGKDNWYKPAINRDGSEIKSLQMSNDDAQWLQARQYGTEEIARCMKVPPHLIGDLRFATFSNIEHQAISFVVNTMMPWFVNWEQAINQQLLLRDDRTHVFAQFKVDGLLRGDIKSRNEALAIQRMWGVLSVDEWRDLIDMNPVGPEKGGEDYLQPANMIVAGSASKGAPQDGDGGEGPDPSNPDGDVDTPLRSLRGPALAKEIRKTSRRLEALYSAAEPMVTLPVPGVADRENERLSEENAALRAQLRNGHGPASGNGNGKQN